MTTSTSRLVISVLAVVAFILAGWSWAYASPPGSAANDRQTLATIWCAWGDSDSCVPLPEGGQVLVPVWIAESSCFAGNRDQDARCTYLSNPSLTPMSVDRIQEQPELFHLTMRALVGPDPARSIVLMRFLNVLLAGALIALAAIVSRPVARRALLLAWAATAAPVATFFIASTSPQSWVMIGVGTFWAFALALFQGPESRPRQLGAVLGAVTSAAMALGANSDSGFLLALSLLIALILAWPRLKDRLSVHRRRWPLPIAVIATSVLITGLSLVTWLGRAGNSDESISLVFPPGDAGRDQPNAILKAVLEIPSFVAALLGAQPPSWAQRMSPLDVGIPGYTWPGFTFGLGHTEHLLPSLVGVFLIAVLGAVTLSGFVSYSWRKVFAFVAVLIAFVAMILFRRGLVAFEFLVDPLLPQEFWPFLLLGVAVALVVFPGRYKLWSGTQIALLVALLTVAQSVALRGTLARYMYGQTHSYTNLSDPNRWWWPSGPEPNQVWLLGTLAGFLAYLAVLTLWSKARPRSKPHGPAKPVKRLATDSTPSASP